MANEMMFYHPSVIDADTVCVLNLFHDVVDMRMYISLIRKISGQIKQAVFHERFSRVRFEFR
jgi:hypothetical protein